MKAVFEGVEGKFNPDTNEVEFYGKKFKSILYAIDYIIKIKIEEKIILNFLFS
jgi:hypothetical protein